MLCNQIRRPTWRVLLSSLRSVVLREGYCCLRNAEHYQQRTITAPDGYVHYTTRYDEANQLPDGSVSFEFAKTLIRKEWKAVDFFSILPNKRFKQLNTLFLYTSRAVSFFGHLISKCFTILDATTSHWCTASRICTLPSSSMTSCEIGRPTDRPSDRPTVRSSVSPTVRPSWQITTFQF